MNPAPENPPAKETVTVCDACLTASCWQGIFMCQSSRNAGIIEKSITELEALGLEHSDYWTERNRRGA
jgi:epoxyqueuosine reductase QueG